MNPSIHQIVSRIEKQNARLDHKHRVLPLVSGGHLTESDLLLLNQLLHNVPRKTMARHFHVSVKAIEKRLARLRSLLCTTGCSCGLSDPVSLHQALAHHDLLAFVLHRTDWFEPDVGTSLL